MDLFDHAKRRPPSGPASGRGPRPQEEVVEGTLERIVFTARNGEFTVARLKVEGKGELETVVGSFAGLPVGARLRVRGQRESNPKFGPQLRAESFTELAPETEEGIRRYLGSGLIKGIGHEFATRIVATFRDRTLEILDASPSRIAEVPGIGRVRARAVQEAWSKQRDVRKVMVFLQGHGLPAGLATRVYRHYEREGADAAIASVRRDPYQLAYDVWGIGFLSADRLAMALGIPKDAETRVAAGVRHVLHEASSSGHCYVPRQKLCEVSAERLGVDVTLVEAAIERLGMEGKLTLVPVDLDTAVYETSLWQAERRAASELARLAGAPSRLELTAEQVDVAIAAYEQSAKLALAPQQAEALRQVLKSPVVVITGGPGVGKTTIVRGIVQILGAKLHIELAAPTGRAAKRLSESTGRTASTLHRLLKWQPKDGRFALGAGSPLDADLLVVDEASMIDVRLAADLFAALATGTRVVLVGDVDQLPSVGPGAVLADAIASQRLPVVRLTEIFRQAARSLIVTNAHRIHDGQLPELGAAPAGGPDERDFFFLEEPDAARAAEIVRDLVATRLPRRYNLSPHDIQVLCPMHRGELGAGNLNTLLQSALTAGAPELMRGARCFRLGDRVMQMRNDYDKDVFNGDVGRIEALDTDSGELRVRFDDREVTYDGDELDALALAYAATVHKSQGSEYPAVVVPIHTQHFVMLQRNLLYTAVTRGKRLVVLVGTRKALGLAVRNGEVALRATRLAAALRES